MTFDLAAEADALAEMRAVQDSLDAELAPHCDALDEAKALVAICDGVRRDRLAVLEACKLDLAGALHAVIVARDSLDEATDLQTLALEALSILRGGDHRVIRRYVEAAEVAA